MLRYRLTDSGPATPPSMGTLSERTRVLRADARTCGGRYARSDGLVARQSGGERAEKFRLKGRRASHELLERPVCDDDRAHGRGGRHGCVSRCVGNSPRGGRICATHTQDRLALLACAPWSAPRISTSAWARCSRSPRSQPQFGDARAAYSRSRQPRRSRRSRTGDGSATPNPRPRAGFGTLAPPPRPGIRSAPVLAPAFWSRANAPNAPVLRNIA